MLFHVSGFTYISMGTGRKQYTCPVSYDKKNAARYSQLMSLMSFELHPMDISIFSESIEWWVGNSYHSIFFPDP